MHKKLKIYCRKYKQGHSKVGNANKQSRRTRSTQCTNHQPHLLSPASHIQPPFASSDGSAFKQRHQATTPMVTLAFASSVGRRTGPIASIEDICAKRSRGKLCSERRRWLPVTARQFPGPLTSVNTVIDTIRQPTHFVCLLLLQPLKLRPLPKRHRFPAA